MLQPESFGDYLQNILEQPEPVRATTTALRDWRLPDHFTEQIESGEIRSVLFTGMGASYHALHPSALELIAHGVRAQSIETSELLYHAPRLLNPRTLVIAVSQSGQSVEIVKLLEQKRGEPFLLVGVTNTPDSPLAAAADAVLLTRAGAEYSVSCKTYVAALAALNLLAAQLTHQDVRTRAGELEQAAAAMREYLARWQEHVAQIAQELENMQDLVLVGRGPSLAAVGTGALIQREAAHFACQEMSSAAFRHGPLEMVSPQMFVLVFCGVAPTTELNQRLAMDIRAAGGRAALVRQDSGGDAFTLPPAAPAALPLLEILVPQIMSLALARRRGLIPGKFERLAKITTTE